MTNKVSVFFAGSVLFIALFSLPQASFAAGVRQESFSTPEKAAEALIRADKAGDETELLKILGPHAQKLISSGDPVADKRGRDKFASAYDALHRLEKRGAGRKILVVGREEWPMPIPIIFQNGRWRFDTPAGESEILDRRIGRNELDVIEVCRAYVEAQRDYAVWRVKTGYKPAYAQKFLSMRGHHDGLYWPASTGEEESPLGPLIAQAQAEGYAPGKKHAPYHGYYYKILKRQGKNAAGGAMDYIKDGRMQGGFALVAFPAKYGDSGIMTFLVNQDGIVFEKNLGRRTSGLAARLRKYDPDATWKPVHTLQ